jgi:hypothetical protein
MKLVKISEYEGTYKELYESKEIDEVYGEIRKNIIARVFYKDGSYTWAAETNFAGGHCGCCGDGDRLKVEYFEVTE